MTTADSNRRALGRGLSTLLPGNRAAASAPPQQTQSSGAAAQTAPEPVHTPLKIAIGLIDPNPVQPRTIFQSERLEELAQSIREHGIIQPLIVRAAGPRYQLIAGERRWRASKLAGLTQVPVIVQDYAEERLMEVTLIENIQREDLNPIEVAQAFDRLAHEHQLSHEQIAQRTGKDRSTVTNMMRLLRLPSQIQLLLAEQRLSMGHARALLGLPTEEQQVQFGERAAAEGLSVRQVEKLVQKTNDPATSKKKAEEEPEVDPNVKAAVTELERALGTRVRIVQKSAQRGRLEIEYYSQDDLQRIYEMIAGS